MNCRSRLAAVFSLVLLHLSFLSATPSFLQTGNTLVMSNADVRLVYHLNNGTTDFYWNNAEKISGFYSGISFNTGYVTGKSYKNWSYTLVSSDQALITATGNNLPAMKQYFTLDQTDSFLVRVEADGTNLSANWMGPLVVDTSGSVNLGVTNDNRALIVPFDNDGFVTYDAMPINNSATGYEVGAFYDNTSRNGLVVGSITHDTWKTGIYYSGKNGNPVQLNVFGGATSPWDVMPHGSVTGSAIVSPTVFVGFGSDWRVTMQNYAAENTNNAPRLAWTNGVPFGWNSWGVLQTSINYTDAIAVSDFFHTNLQPAGFSNTGTVYINLDSYWNNLNDFELESFVNHCHADGQKAGVYLTPFAWFGSAADATNTYVEGTTNAWLYSDILLRDGNGNFESVDGGLAVDPTHPGARERINYYVEEFTNWGFDYVKLDFLSHGALEGVHYDTNITTGIQAYNQGMQYVLTDINNRMFVSESIAPLFPYQYAHSRRIACDSYTSLISNTEYTMNSVSYGWWLNDLYQFNDPDIMVFNGYGATTNENQSRLINAAATGIFLDGDDLTTAAGQSAAESCLTNAAINAVARVGQTFTPVEGNTGTSAASVFVRQENASTWSLAVFNYSSATTNEAVDLSRVGLPAGAYFATDLWAGTSAVVTGTMNVSLNSMQSKLFQLTDYTSQDLRWATGNNNGIWDTAISTNWIDLSNNSRTAFVAGDSVLFDDTSGVPTTVTVNGTVTPGLLTVDSNTNQYTIQGSGSITGVGGLVKQGTSLLTIYSAGAMTGPLTISGGAIYAGNNSLDAVSSIAISNGATLDLGGSTFANDTPVSVSGTGLNGEGALFNSYTNDPQALLNITLAGNTKFGGSSRWDFTSGSKIAGPYDLTLDLSAGAGYTQWNSMTIGASVPQITLTNSGTLGMTGMDTSCQSPATLFNIGANDQLVLYAGGFNGSISLASGAQLVVYSANVSLGGSTIHVYNGATMYLYAEGIAMTGNSLIFENEAALQTYYNSGVNPIGNAVTLNGVAHFVLGNHDESFSGVVGGAGGFVLDYYDHELEFLATNTYTGPTIIGSSGNSPEVALVGNGSISDSSLIFFGGSDPTVAHLDVSGRNDDTLTLASGQTLAGIGGVNGNLVVAAGATISPAGTNTTIGITTGNSAVGELAASGNVTLNGTTVIKLNGSGTNDVIVAGANLQYGGTLSLVNISGSALALGNSFQVFTAANYLDSFASVTPAIPGAGLAWDTSHLGSGLIKIIAASSGPIFGRAELSGNNLVMSGTGGSAGATFYVVGTTNLTIPLSQWPAVSTNHFDNSGNFAVTNAIVPGVSKMFYKIQL